MLWSFKNGGVYDNILLLLKDEVGSLILELGTWGWSSFFIICWYRTWFIPSCHLSLPPSSSPLDFQSTKWKEEWDYVLTTMIANVPCSNKSIHENNSSSILYKYYLLLQNICKATIILQITINLIGRKSLFKNLS